MPANTLGTLAATGVFHDALGITLKKVPFIKRLASDISPTLGFKNMPFNVSQTLKNYNVGHTVSDRAATGTYARQAGIVAGADQTFALNQWPYISFGFTLVELNQMINSAGNADARAGIIAKLMSKAFNTLAISITASLVALVNAARFPLSYVNAVGAMDYKKLGAAVDVFLANDTLMEAPSAILDITCFRELANSLTVVPNSTFDAGKVINTGVITEPVSGAQDISRFNIAMPADATRGILFDPSSILFANRVPIEEELPNDPVWMEIVTDPDTGFSIMLREAKDPMTGEVTRTITTLYGFGVGLANHLVRLVPA